MLFRKRKRPGSATGNGGGFSDGLSTPTLFHITFEMMQKASVIDRGRTSVRQHAVMVGGHIRLVTSGDTVDKKTYDALIEAGVVVAPTPVVEAEAPEPVEDEQAESSQSEAE